MVALTHFDSIYVKNHRETEVSPLANLYLVESYKHIPSKGYEFHKGTTLKNEKLCIKVCKVRLKQLRTEIGLYYASPHRYYRAAWTRDCLNVIFPFLGSDNSVETIHTLLDKFKNDEESLNKIIECPNCAKPNEHPHPKFSATTGENIHDEYNPWGFLQNDAIGQFLYTAGLSIELGRNDIIRDKSDLKIIQKLINYQIAINYPTFYDNGVWEEQSKLNVSSIASVVAGLEKMKQLQGTFNEISEQKGYNVNLEVPQEGINMGKKTLNKIFRENNKEELTPIETPSFNYGGGREHDLTLLFLPMMGMADKEFTKKIIKSTEENLLKERGVIRYKGDRYYNRSTNEEHYPKEVKVSQKEQNNTNGYEAEWILGLSYLSIDCQLVAQKAKEEGNMDEAEIYFKKSEYYKKRTETVMTNKGVAELFYGRTNITNVNNPLSWANSLYVTSAKLNRGEIGYINLMNDFDGYLQCE